MELLTLEKIIKIAFFKKGEHIDHPGIQYYVGTISIDGFETQLVKISRKSLKHIIEKEDIGIMFAFSLRKLLETNKKIVKNFKDNDRYFVFNIIESKKCAIVLETKNIPFSIVTAMYIDNRYLEKHFPEISIQ